MLLRFLCLIFQSMATSHIPQIFLRITVQNQIHVAQRVVIDKVVSSVCCAIVTSSTSSTPVQQLHAAGVYVEFAGSFIVLHVCVLSTLRHLYSCDLCDTVFLLIRFRTHSRLVRAGACRGKAPPSCLRKTALPLKSPTGALVPVLRTVALSSPLIRCRVFPKGLLQKKRDSLFGKLSLKCG